VVRRVGSTSNEYLATELPPVHDPFAGGGTIPLEAQRLGLRAIATDLNPVAVMINKALIEIPPKFAGMPPINPESRANGKLKSWRGAEGLAEDVSFYGAWMREEAKRRIGDLYPEVDVPKDRGGGKASVVAWIWARTVESPNPAFRGCHVPLVSSYWLSSKSSAMAWLVPVVDGRNYRFEVRSGVPESPEALSTGTKLGRGANFRCLLSDTPIEPAYVKSEAMKGRLGARLLACVVEGKRNRLYVPATTEAERVALNASPTWEPEGDMPVNPRWFSPPDYGMPRFADLFTRRQLVALGTFADLLGEVRQRVSNESKVPAGYADAVALYLTFAFDKMLDTNTSLCTWQIDPPRLRTTFGRQALPMTWDYAETNPFGGGAGDYEQCLDTQIRVIRNLAIIPGPQGDVSQADATTLDRTGLALISTDPPYYDNIGYAELSDFFYVWLRRTAREILPSLFGTMLSPKEAELIAAPYRHGGKERAEAFFINGMSTALQHLRARHSDSSPLVIYYAFKQAELAKGAGAGVSSTGWETFLNAVLASGLGIDGTWPVRTEWATRMVSKDTNALASSIVLVCRSRADDAPSTTRGDFRRMLRKELPDALKKLQQGNIAPVDVAQASIGPGMSIFSRHKQVSEADGSAMSVRSALQLINEVLDEYLSSGEGDFDADTRFAITWYELHGWEAGSFGDAANIATARNVSVKGVEEAGICTSAAGKVRILKRSEMRPLDYDPAADERPTVWEFTQHMIRNLEEDGEEAAARLLKKLGPAADATRELAYRLYNTCERKKWTEDARSYNGLILAWTELEKLASGIGDESPPAAPSKTANGKKKPEKPPKGTKAQRDLFEGDKK
jgi:putative DNA methylase